MSKGSRKWYWLNVSKATPEKTILSWFSKLISVGIVYSNRRGTDFEYPCEWVIVAVPSHLISFTTLKSLEFWREKNPTLFLSKPLKLAEINKPRIEKGPSIEIVMVDPGVASSKFEVNWNPPNIFFQKKFHWGVTIPRFRASHIFHLFQLATWGSTWIAT